MILEIERAAHSRSGEFPGAAAPVPVSQGQGEDGSVDARAGGEAIQFRWIGHRHGLAAFEVVEVIAHRGSLPQERDGDPEKEC
jgi:hypothetical protein